MKENVTQMTIIYPNGVRHVVRPSFTFNGDWATLAEAIARPYYPFGSKIDYTLK